MILDVLENLKMYGALSVNLEKAISYITENNLLNFEIGKHDIAGNDVFVLISEYDTKDEVDCKTESHKNYIDIQIMLKGDELFGLAFLDNQKVSVPYDAEKDCVFYDASLEYIKLKENSFAIFFPGDIHCPSIKIETSTKVKKAVVKVRV